MDRQKIERINALARKQRSVGLSDEERLEQKRLRDEYRAEFRRSLAAQLDRIEFIAEKQEGE